MEATEDKLKELQTNCGIDFIALKQKYSKHEYNNNNKTSEFGSVSASMKQQQFDSLDKYSICKSCLGAGVTKSIYNHMVLERTCNECNGDSILLNPKYNAQLTSGEVSN